MGLFAVPVIAIHLRPHPPPSLVTSRTRSDGGCGRCACHSRPLPYAPACYEPVQNVRVGSGEALCYVRRFTFEEQDRLIGRIRQRAAKDQFAAIACRPSEGQMLLAVLRA